MQIYKKNQNKLINLIISIITFRQSFKCHEIAGQWCLFPICCLLQTSKPSLRTGHTKLVNIPPVMVNYLERILLIVQHNLTSNQRHQFARFPFKIAPLMAFKRLWWKIHNRCGPNLQPISLPWTNRWFSTIF